MLVSMIADDDPKREIEPDEVEDFGFHFPVDYLKLVIQVLRLSNFTYWPRAGGLDNQDSSLIRDVFTWLMLERRLKWEYLHGQWQEKTKEGGAKTTYDPMTQPH